MVNLTARSVLFFIPKAKIICTSFYKHDINEYDQMEPLLPSIENHFFKTKYINPTNKPHDHIDSTKTSGWANSDNCHFFTEGYNCAFELVKETDEKVLLLAEDHFFTTGKVLNELQQNDFSVAYAPWDNETDANASILCIRPHRVKHLFPISESPGLMIEHRLRDELISKVDQSELYKIIHRRRINYFGDGFYTNSSYDIRNALIESAII